VEAEGLGGFGKAIRKTRELIMNQEPPAIFEPVFQHQDVILRADILQRENQYHKSVMVFGSKRG
jgi:hypothetical protein